MGRVNLKTAALRLGVHYQTAYRWKWACVLFGVAIIIIVPLVLHFAFHKI